MQVVESERKNGGNKLFSRPERGEACYVEGTITLREAGENYDPGKPTIVKATGYPSRATGKANI